METFIPVTEQQYDKFIGELHRIALGDVWGAGSTEVNSDQTTTTFVNGQVVALKTPARDRYAIRPDVAYTSYSSETGQYSLYFWKIRNKGSQGWSNWASYYATAMDAALEAAKMNWFLIATADSRLRYNPVTDEYY